MFMVHGFETAITRGMMAQSTLNLSSNWIQNEGLEVLRSGLLEPDSHLSVSGGISFLHTTAHTPPASITTASLCS